MEFVNLQSQINHQSTIMKKTILTFGAMLFLGVGVSMAQSAEATSTAPAVEKSCSKGKKDKACCAAKAAATGDAAVDKKDCNAAGTAAAPEQKATRATTVESVSTGTAPVVK